MRPYRFYYRPRTEYDGGGGVFTGVCLFTPLGRGYTSQGGYPLSKVGTVWFLFRISGFDLELEQYGRIDTWRLVVINVIRWCHSNVSKNYPEYKIAVCIVDIQTIKF